MSDHKPSEPKPSDFKEAGQRSQAAGIADENASYANAGGENAPLRSMKAIRRRPTMAAAQAKRTEAA